MNETLTGRTTREIVFSYIDHATRVCKWTERRPAGTTVYVSRIDKDGTWTIRIPGTLLTQNVRPGNSVEPF
jgi:hypothetical protein